MYINKNSDMKVEDNKDNLNEPGKPGELLNEVIEDAANLTAQEAADELLLHSENLPTDPNSPEYQAKINEQMQQLHEMGIDPRTLRRYPKKPFVRSEAKVGRNEPCTCGSGKKYKNCCGA